MLANPRRLVIDLPQGHLTHPILLQQYRASPIRQIRWSQNAARLRLVFSLDNQVKVHVRSQEASDSTRPELIIAFGAENNVPSGLPTERMTQETPKTIISSDSFSNKPRNIIVVIDPGHGGKDPGAIGRGGVKEKNITLAISKKLYTLINSEPGFTAKLTRDADYYITLRQRLAIARQYHADMFIAIHADKWRNKTAKGASVFALSERGATSEAAHWLATRENKSELRGGVTLGDKSQVLKSVLIDLSQSATIQSSLQIGHYLINSLAQITPMHVHRIEQAAFVVLKSPDIPSLLVETGFLSNPEEERELTNPIFQTRMAYAINAGLVHYYEEHPPRNSLLAKKRKTPPIAP